MDGTPRRGLALRSKAHEVRPGNAPCAGRTPRWLSCRYGTPRQACTAARSTCATSTQLPPLPLRLLFCHVTMVSTQLPPLPLWLLVRHVDGE
jgi:hypothetical protein